MSPWLIQTYKRTGRLYFNVTDFCRVYRTQKRGGQTFLRILPRICASRFSPSKQVASSRPFPSIFVTWAYSASTYSSVCFSFCKTRQAEGWATVAVLLQAPAAGSEPQSVKGKGKRTLAILLEYKLSFLAFVLILSSSAVLTALRNSKGTMRTPRSMAVRLSECIRSNYLSLVL
jgi:hypothetical protein